jgi:preprotein translocase subunit YajC
MSLAASLVTLLAQTATRPAPPAPDFFSPLNMGIILAAAAFFWIYMRSQKKERQRFADMLNALKRNDRVQTIGGIYGTVVDVRDNEVVLKVDESSNVKIRFNRQAIKEILREAAGPSPAEPPRKS